MSAYQPTGLKLIYHESRRLLAKNWLKLFHPIQIAVTGSQGKTNTVQLLAKILSQFGSTVVTDINLDTVYNVPITALKVRPWTKFLVWELGIDRPGEMSLHLEIAKPQIAVVTGISPVHTDSEHLGSLEKLIAEKRKLIEALPKSGVTILNYDDKNVRQMAGYTKAKVLFYGTDKSKCSVYADNIVVSLQGTKFKLLGKTISIKLIGAHHIYTIMAAFQVLLTLSSKDQQLFSKFKQIVSSIKPLQGRMSVDAGPLGTTILNDSLRANPESTRAGLETLSMISYKIGKKIAVLGVMGELADPKKEHQEIGRRLVRYLPDIVICLGDWQKFTYETALNNGFPKDRIFYAKNVFEAAAILKKIIKKGDLIYLKGSFLRNLKRIVQILNHEPLCCHADICPYDHCGYPSYF